MRAVARPPSPPDPCAGSQAVPLRRGWSGSRSWARSSQELTGDVIRLDSGERNSIPRDRPGDAGLELNLQKICTLALPLDNSNVIITSTHSSLHFKISESRSSI